MARKGFSFTGLVEYINGLVAGTEKFTAIKATGNISTDLGVYDKGGRVFSPDNLPTWAQSGGDEYFRVFGKENLQVESDRWLHASKVETGFLPLIPNTPNGYLGIHEWQFKSANVESYYGNLVNINQSAGGNGCILANGGRVGHKHISTENDVWTEYSKVGQVAYSVGINTDNSFNINQTNGNGVYSKTVAVFSPDRQAGLPYGLSSGGYITSTSNVIEFKNNDSTHLWHRDASGAEKSVAWHDSTTDTYCMRVRNGHPVRISDGGSIYLNDGAIIQRDGNMYIPYMQGHASNRALYSNVNDINARIQAFTRIMGDALELYIDGAAFGVSIWRSDAKFKENIRPLDSHKFITNLHAELPNAVSHKTKSFKSTPRSLDKIADIEFVSYDWKKEHALDKEKLHVPVGVTSQQLQSIDETFVMKLEGDVLAPNTNVLVTHLLRAVKELKEEVDTLKEQLNK